MVNVVIINDRSFEVTNYHEETVTKENNEGKRLKISFNFNVTSDEYHDVTTLLYENDFQVKIPEKNIEFNATINQYSTSLTNLYEENKVSKYTLELNEKGI